MPGIRSALLTVGATLLLTGALRAPPVEAVATPEAAKVGERSPRNLAIESVQRRLQENPRDEGLRRAAACLEHEEQCQDMHSLDRAMDSVRRSSERHPQDQGLRHAIEQLERRHEQLERRRMERERSMRRDNTDPRENLERH